MFHCWSCQLEREKERARLKVGFKAPAGVCQQRESLEDISFLLWSFQTSSWQQEAGGGMGTPPEVCAFGRALTLAVTHACRGKPEMTGQNKILHFLNELMGFF